MNQLELSSLNRSGIARLSDLNDLVLQRYLAEAESEQTRFLARESHFRSKAYRWPRDSLHTWSRVWEYPFVAHHLERRFESNVPRGKVADVGSGTTFFPFMLERYGWEVICVDVDPICKKDMERAIAELPPRGGKVEFRSIEGARLPFHDNELDAVYSVSVLEHVPEFENTLREISRVLKPGGLFVLTIDLDLRGDADIGVPRFFDLKCEVSRLFELVEHYQSTHPADMLLSTNGPFPITRVGQGALRSRLFTFLKKNMMRPLLGRPRVPFLLAVEGMVVAKPQ